MPDAEVLLWMKLKGRQLHGERFLRQYGVDEFVIDFYCPRLKLAIEVDGSSHIAKDAEFYDRARQGHIEAYGIHFLRFTNADVYNNLDGVLQSIYQYVDEVGGQFPAKRGRGRTPLDPPFSEGGIENQGGSRDHGKTIEAMKTVVA